MAGERLAKLTIEASFAIDDTLRGLQTERVRLAPVGHVFDDQPVGGDLPNQPFQYQRGLQPSQRRFPVPDPDDVGRAYVQQAVDGLVALLRLDVQALGLAYVVSASRDVGDTLTSPPQPRVQFDVEATGYDPQLNLAFTNLSFLPTGFRVVQNLTTLQPIQVAQLVQPAGVYGSATGSIYLTATGGNTPPFTYRWADDALASGPVRQNLRAGAYTCLVRDADGVSTTVTCVVTSDALLQVTVQQTEDSIRLQVSGGVAPYAVAWDDGPTSFSRTGLASGSYAGTVTDAHGASQRVEVTLLPNRCYYSRNPIRLALDAGAAYRADRTTKPNLSFVAEVWVEPDYLSGVFVQVGPQLEQPAASDGTTVFEVQALLDVYVQEHLPTLAGPAVAGLAGGLFKRFYLKSAEKYGTPPVGQALSTAQVHVVLCGGLPPAEAAAGTWPAYQAAVQPFLTWEPSPQAVLPIQPACLYYQHLSAEPEAQVWVRTVHVDGSSSAAVVTTLTQLHRWEVYYLRVGPQQLGLAGPEVRGYDVWVSDAAGTPRTLVRGFTLDRAYYPHPRFFVYSNSLGGANVLAALGAGKLTLEVKASETPRPAYDPALGDVATLDRVGTPTLSVSTSPRRRAQQVADQELLLSRRVALLADGAYWPGRVAAASFVVRDEAAGLARLAFDFVLAGQRHFGPRLPAVVAGQGIIAVAGGEGPQP